MPWRTFTPSGQEKVAQQGIATVPIGTMVAFGGTAAPSGWLFCDGSNVSRTTYADLFAAIGVTWGPGDGSTTFKLPDLRGRSLLGAGVGAGLTSRVAGATGGEEKHQLLLAETVPHYHDVRSLVSQRPSDGMTGVMHPQALGSLTTGQPGDGYHWGAQSDFSAPLGFPSAQNAYQTWIHSQRATQVTGEIATSHENMHPWAAAHHIIKYQEGFSGQVALFDGSIATAKIADGAVTPVKVAQQPYVVLARAAAQQIPTGNNAAIINWDTEIADPLNMFSTPVDKFTIPRAGVWQISGRAFMSVTGAAGGASTLTGVIMKNGVDAWNVWQEPIYAAVSFVYISSFAQTAVLAANDTIGLRLFQNTGTNYNCTYAEISAVWQGPA